MHAVDEAELAMHKERLELWQKPRNERVTMTIPDDPAKLGYLAGIIDGEGNIGINLVTGAKGQRTPSFSPRMTIVNCDPRMLLWLCDHFGGKVRPRQPKNNPAHWNTSYHWSVYGPNLEALLKAVYPYLVTKREHADIALRLCELRTHNSPIGPTEEEVAEKYVLKRRIAELNRRPTKEQTTA